MEAPARPHGSVRRLVGLGRDFLLPLASESGSLCCFSGLPQTLSDKATLGLPGAGLILSGSFLPDLKAPRKASSYRKTSRI